MPTITRTAPSILVPPTGNAYNSGQIHPIFVDRFDKPLTVRRPKPADLFANSTARRVVRSVAEYTYGTLSNSPWNQWKTNAPFTYWVGKISNPSSLSEPSVNSFSTLDNRVRHKIKDQNVNLANTMAEYRQISNLLFSTAHDVIRTFHSLRSGRALRDFVSMLSHPKTRNAKRLSNRWLEYQYGWRPLLNDVHSGAEALAKKLQTGVYLHQTASDRRTDKGFSPYVLGGTSFEATLRMRVRARYKISTTGLKTLSELGFANPLSLAWELVPYSFVIDWIIPVGDYLGGLDALVGVSDLTVLRSYKLEVKAFQALNYSGGGQAFGPYPTATLNETITGRLAPSSSLSFGNLRYDPSLTKTRLANAMALLRQLKR